MDGTIHFSELNTYIRCPKQYEFKELIGIRMPKNLPLANGSACHKAVETNYKQKINTKEDLKLQDVKDVYATAFEEEASELEGFSSLEKAKTKDGGVVTVGTYHTAIASKIQPKLVEEKFEIEVANAVLAGTIDVYTEDDSLRDFKTANKVPTKPSEAYKLQLGIYSLAHPEARSFGIDLVSGANKAVFNLKKEDLPISKIPHYINALNQSLITGLFPPTHPDNWCCSEKWCGFWNICPYGGKK